MFKSFSLLKVNTSAAAWVRVYDNLADQTSDSSRTNGTSPTAGMGVLADITTSGASTFKMSPGVVCYNDESTPTSYIPVSITNRSGSSATISVTFTIVQLEN